MKNDNFIYERYQRQIIIKEFGEAGQQKLLQARVLVIGAGGLGSPALLYLAAAGVGWLGIIDDDQVSLSNLHRQVLYSTAEIGYAKTEKAKERLLGLNPDIHVETFTARLTTQNALDIFGKFDIIIDGSDNFSTRYMVNDACVLLNKPLVYGAVSQFEGQVAVFNCQSKNGDRPVNYRDLFPDPPPPGEVLNCAEAGVLGVLPGIIGTMLANETIKLITGIGKPLINKLLTYNALNNEVYDLLLSPNEATLSMIPGSAPAFEQMNYDWLCSIPGRNFDVSPEVFNHLLETNDLEIIDVREPDELPKPGGFQYRQIPLSQFRENMAGIEKKNVVLFCQSGKRSQQAAQWLSEHFGDSKNIYSLKGGILNWVKNRII